MFTSPPVSPVSCVRSAIGLPLAWIASPPLGARVSARTERGSRRRARARRRGWEAAADFGRKRWPDRSACAVIAPEHRLEHGGDGARRCLAGQLACWRRRTASWEGKGGATSSSNRLGGDNTERPYTSGHQRTADLRPAIRSATTDGARDDEGLTAGRSSSHE